MNRYTVICQVGDGSFGGVSKAAHNATGEIVAIKKMKQRFSSWDECLQLREVQSLRRLQHPNMIKLKEVIRENTELFLIFEFMEMNVYQIMRQRLDAAGHGGTVFCEKEIRSIVCQTLLGLQAMHKGGFFHRDLKPENLLTKGDVVKIADFGLAKEIRSRPPFTEYVSTRWYRAPEVILRSTHYNSPIDIWALGVIFAELYTGRPLFPGASDPDQLFKICSLLGSPSMQEWDEGHQLARKLGLKFPSISPTPLKSAIPQASAVAIDLMEQMLKFNPADRPTATTCLQHPFFTGSSQTEFPSAFGTQSSAPATLYQGIISKQAHNPFHLAAGVPGSSSTTVDRKSGLGPFSAVPHGNVTPLPGSSTSSIGGAAFGGRDALPYLQQPGHRTTSQTELSVGSSSMIKDVLQGEAPSHAKDFSLFEKHRSTPMDPFGLPSVNPVNHMLPQIGPSSRERNALSSVGKDPVEMVSEARTTLFGSNARTRVYTNLGSTPIGTYQPFGAPSGRTGILPYQSALTQPSVPHFVAPLQPVEQKSTGGTQFPLKTDSFGMFSGGGRSAPPTWLQPAMSPPRGMGVDKVSAKAPKLSGRRISGAQVSRTGALASFSSYAPDDF